MIIRLPAEPHETLSWAEEKITWEFDLGLQTPYFPLEDAFRFQSLALALTKFSNDVWPRFKDQTAGAVLYRGPTDFSTFFAWTETQEANWKLWRLDQPDAPETHLRRLFSAEAFVAYFQMLAHKLPDELPLILELDVRGFNSLAECLHLLSPERFAHFQVKLEGLPPQIALHAPLGVCFPEQWDGEVLEEIDQFLAEQKEPVRAVFEATLTEQWDGLDRLYISRISEQGKRKLAGFTAAGGTVLELSCPESGIRGRGI